jgi:formyl-CoA transferase
MADDSPGCGPLVGVRVVEFAQVVAGPLAGTLLADLGADVVHVEAPQGGDDARRMGPTKDGHPLWWKVLGRNKRSVTLDLRQAASQPVVRRLIEWADVVIVTFRASTAQRFGLDWTSVHELNPSAVLLQITGHGATSSRRDEPGFGKMGEARSGVVHLTGFADGPPIHTGFSHGDATTGLMGAFAVTAALRKRDADPGRRGEWIDLSLSDTLFRLIEWQVIVHDQLGIVPTRAGNALAVAPGAVINTYESADGAWITVTSATAKSVTNIAVLLGLPRDEYLTVSQQLANKEELDRALSAWVTSQPADTALKAMRDADVVASRVMSVADIVDDPVFRERESVVTVTDQDLGDVRMQSVVPRLHGNPGRVWRTGADLGADTDLVLHEWLGFARGELQRLQREGVI